MQQVQSVIMENNNNNSKCNGTPIDFHTVKVPKKNTTIDNKTFFNMGVLFIKDNRINNSESYSFIDEHNKIMDLF